MKLIIDKNANTYPYKDIVHTKWGMLKTSEMKDGKGKTNKGHEMYIISQSFHDIYRKIRRKAQIMLPKDIGRIIAECNLNKNSKVIDCGSGSGGTTCMLASLTKKVYSYDIRKDHLETAKKNADMLGLKNIIFREVDIYKSCPDKDADAVILDIPEPWKALDSIRRSIRSGGFLVNYSPNLTQVKTLSEEIRASDDFLYIKTIELIEREWETDNMKLRPKFRMLGHTAFLTFARKIGA